MVAATIGEADRLWNDWQAFDKTEPITRFIPIAAYEEFSGVVEGIGRNEPGILEELISFSALTIMRARPVKPGVTDLSSMCPDRECIQRIERLIETLKDTIGGTWDSDKALEALRIYETKYVKRKRDFLAKHFIYTPPDEGKWQILSSQVKALIPSGGSSWHNDCNIVSQAAMYWIDNKIPTTYVTEDRKHFAKHCPDIISLTGLSGIRDLRGKPL